MTHVFFECPRRRALWWCNLTIRNIWPNFESFTLWLMQVLQELWKDGHSSTVELIILLLYDLWHSRNQSLHQGKRLPPVQGMVLLQQEHHLHSTILLTRRLEGIARRVGSLGNHLGIPGSSTAGDLAWIVRIDRVLHLRQKASVVSIFYHNQLLNKLKFRRTPHQVTSFWNRSLRAGLQWITSCPYPISGCSLGLFVDKACNLAQLLSSSTDTVSGDINLLLSLYSTFHFYEKTSFARSLMRDELHESHVFHLL